MTLYNIQNMEILYPQVATVERYAFDLAVSKLGTMDTHVYLTELTLLYNVQGYPDPEARIRIWAQAWALPPANITVGGDLVVRWSCNAASILNISNLYLFGRLALCMPFGQFVNPVYRAVTVPPPC